MKRKFETIKEFLNRPIPKWMYTIRNCLLLVFLVMSIISVIFVFVGMMRYNRSLDELELNSEWQLYANNLEKEIIEFMNDVGDTTEYKYSKMRVLLMKKRQGYRMPAGTHLQHIRAISLNNPPEFPQDIDEQMYTVLVHEIIHFVRHGRHFITQQQEEFYVQWLTQEFCKNKCDIKKCRCPYDNVVNILRWFDEKIPLNLLILFLRNDEQAYENGIKNLVMELGYDEQDATKFYNDYIHLFYEIWDSIMDDDIENEWNNEANLKELVYWFNYYPDDYPLY